MTKKLSTLVAFLWICACKFDEEWQYNKLFPATLTIVNASDSTVEVKEIYADLNSGASFSIKGSKLKHGEIFSARLFESDYDAILAGKFFIEIVCNNKVKTVSGDRFERLGIHNEEQWTVQVTITECIKE